MTADEPIRRCILTGEHGARAGLIRLALGPDGEVLPDLAARAPGRGAWVTPDRRLLADALRKGRLKGALARAFKTGEFTIPADLVERIEAGLERRALDRLGLENRAGHLIFGFDRIVDSIDAARVHLLLAASDAGSDGERKLEARAQRLGLPKLRLPATRRQLSLALGRENVVHAAVSDRLAADRIAVAVERWRAFGETSELRDGPAGVSAGTMDGLPPQAAAAPEGV